MERKNYYLPGPLLQRLAKAVALKGVSASEIVRIAVSEYLDRLFSKEKK